MNIHIPAATKIDPIAATDEATVVSEYTPEPRQLTGYESEAQLEERFIQILQSQAYEYLTIHTEADLAANLRAQLEKLNKISFTDTEWDEFYRKTIANTSYGVLEKTELIQKNHVHTIRREDGSSVNIALIDKERIHNNSLQVINQYETEGGSYSNRYDVTILVNGLPMVHVELKKRGVQLKEAFNQINRYQRDSFWADSGLFEYVQIFVISNGTRTKYYANTVRNKHTGNDVRRSSQATDTFEFTSWWADAENKAITELTAFAKTFFARHTILNILAKYCVFTVDKDLLVMRPYQIVATERILRRIDQSTYAKTWGTLDAGGYIWHTTGSGKTLTSFKTAQLATGMQGIDKVLFVVDRKDLDYQTMKEYDAFEKGAANSNKSTAVLKRQLEDPNARIIITTIQKLSTFIKANPKHPVFAQHNVLIFDECHRSQFGDMHTAITKNFKKYHLFGFTGTPIFAANSSAGGDPKLKTTEQAFGDKLHTYTIVDAIGDKNVLPFRVEYLKTVDVGRKEITGEAYGIRGEEALRSPSRVRRIVEYILEHYDQKTKRNSTYSYKDQRLSGFNSILATASIEAAKVYYNMFGTVQDELFGVDNRKLKVATIFTYAANEEVGTGLLGEEGFDPGTLDASSRDFLEDAIQDYNEMFGTSYDTSSYKFENYYKDIAKRLKNRDLDLVIVVNMFLTGFDSKTINTLWVDKHLHSHGLIQAFSRTNRILNSVKTYGNIVCFRNLEEETQKALTLFGNKNARGTVLLKPFGEYLSRYVELTEKLKSGFALDGSDMRILGEENQKDFIKTFGEILRLRNILTSFDEFASQDVLDERSLQDYQSIYLDIYRDIREQNKTEKEDITEDLVFEIELLKQVEVSVDFILALVAKKREESGDGDDREILAEINSAVNSSPTLRNKQDLIEEFIARISAMSSGDVHEEWQKFVEEKSDAELAAIIEDERLKEEPTRRFVKDSFERGSVSESGTALASILPSMGSRFRRKRTDDSGSRSVKKRRVFHRLQSYFERFNGLVRK